VSEVEGLQSPVFHKARLKPLEWKIDCPVCENVILVEACENNDASWHGDNGDQFPQCDNCGALIEALPVQVVDFAS
jgi:hypothetical protein